jgi:hypothetical protein
MRSNTKVMIEQNEKKIIYGQNTNFNKTNHCYGSNNKLNENNAF